MELAGFKNKALRRFWEEGQARGLPVQNTAKLETLLRVLFRMSVVEEFLALPIDAPHQLTGDRRGTYAVSVTANWRLTFRIEDDAVIDLDLEDYH